MPHRRLTCCAVPAQCSGKCARYGARCIRRRTLLSELQACRHFQAYNRVSQCPQFMSNGSDAPTQPLSDQNQRGVAVNRPKHAVDVCIGAWSGLRLTQRQCRRSLPDRINRPRRPVFENRFPSGPQAALPPGRSHDLVQFGGPAAGLAPRTANLLSLHWARFGAYTPQKAPEEMLRCVFHSCHTRNLARAGLGGGLLSKKRFCLVENEPHALGDTNEKWFVSDGRYRNFPQVSFATLKYSNSSGEDRRFDPQGP